DGLAVGLVPALPDDGEEYPVIGHRLEGLQEYVQPLVWTDETEEQHFEAPALGQEPARRREPVVDWMESMQDRRIGPQGAGRCRLLCRVDDVGVGARQQAVGQPGLRPAGIVVGEVVS